MEGVDSRKTIGVCDRWDHVEGGREKNKLRNDVLDVEADQVKDKSQVNSWR